MKTTFYFFTLWLLIVIFFYAIQTVFFHTTTQITIAANSTLNFTHESSVLGHMIRFSDIFQIIMVIFIIGFGALVLLSLVFDMQERRERLLYGGDQFER